MTFHGRSNPGKNKCSIGYRHEQGHTFQVHQTAVEAAGPAADPDTTDTDPAGPPLTKKERSNNNWRSTRGIVVQDKKVERVFFQQDAMAKSNVSLSKTVCQKKSKVNKLEQKNYVNAKASRTASLEKEEQHKLAITLLCKNHACDIEAAFAVADEETNKKLEAEKLRLISEKYYSTNLRTERQRSSGKIKKKRASQKTINEYSHKRWMQNLASNLTKKNKEHQKEVTKLQKKFYRKDREINDERQKNQER